MSRELILLEKLEKDLSLKELQIKSLLTITQAINENVSADGLFNMYKSFLSWEMGIDRMGLFIPEGGQWKCASHINLRPNQKTPEIMELLLKYNRLHTVKDTDPDLLQMLDIIIPVFHKEAPIAYAIIGGIKDKNDLYNKIQFITTITNIIAVAIENKRLFKEQIEQEKFKKEIELAGEVQKMLIPKTLPKSENIDLSMIYKPHLNIGGDYLDVIRFDETRIALCIADISGKGVPAALLMANFQAMTQSLIYQYRDLETFVFALNQTVYRVTQSDKFITFFVCELDVKAKKLKYVNAGHYPPVFYNKGKIHRLEEGCTVIGAFEKLPEIKEATIDLDGESLIMCFTDGLADLRNNFGEYYDDDKIEKFVRAHGNKNTDDFNQQLLVEIDKFKEDKEYPDDIAILTCKVFT
ncbi:MAG: SpoIIE family protein phosphatase [Saprospiraceae bacterium]